MFNCRVCANTPFGAMFGYDETKNSDIDKKSRRRKRDAIASQLSKDDSSVDASIYNRSSSEDRRRFRPRNPEEILTKVQSWECYLHKRAEEFWSDPGSVRETLIKVAKAVDKHSDPILAEVSECVFWHGDLDEETGTPIIHMVKPGNTTESDVAVTRILVFLYADDESFQELQQKSQESFKMICNEPLCINLSHISLD